jgi:hypothetical protein
MPIKPAPRNISETEYMLRLLRCVDALDCATELSLWTFAAELELMDYVTMRLCLHKLLQAEQVQYGEGAMKSYLYLTQKGRQALQLFGDRLPAEIVGKIQESVGKFRERLTNSQQVRAAYEIAKRNEYRLNLSVSEGDLTVLQLRMHTKSRRLAGRAIRQFEAQAPKVVMYLFQLAQGAQAMEPAETFGEGEIVRHSATEFEARHTLTGKRAALDVTLTLPSEEAARQYLAQFREEAVAADAAEKLLKLICAIRF